MFIPDPDFYPSRIQHKQQQGEGGEIVDLPFFEATNFTILKIFNFWTGSGKKIGANLQRIIAVVTQTNI